ncbi:unnamed protein product, partial [Ectocarpus sp. 8 AP-2014]
KQSAALKQQIAELEARVETAAARTAEVEANIAGSVEEGVRAAKEETAEARRLEEEGAKAAGEVREALAAARSDLDKTKRELKQRGQLARNLLAEKDAEINRLRSGEAGGGLMHLRANGDGGILQMARVQAQRDEETGRLRVKIQRLADEIRAREEELAARDDEKEGLRKRVEDLQGEAARAKELLDDATGPEKMTYLKNVVKRFVMSDGTERQRLVPVVATILSFSPAETSEV